MSVLLDAASAAVETVQPALSILEKTVIGSVLVISLGLTVASIYALIRVQNARVEDQKDASRRLETTHTKMVDAFSQFRQTLESLERSDDASQKALQLLNRDISQVTSKIDLMIAMRGGRR